MSHIAAVMFPYESTELAALRTSHKSAKPPANRAAFRATCLLPLVAANDATIVSAFLSTNLAANVTADSVSVLDAIITAHIFSKFSAY